MHRSHRSPNFSMKKLLYLVTIYFDGKFSSVIQYYISENLSRGIKTTMLTFHDAMHPVTSDIFSDGNSLLRPINQ